jgi:hypothetical protein
MTPASMARTAVKIGKARVQRPPPACAVRDSGSVQRDELRTPTPPEYRTGQASPTLAVQPGAAAWKLWRSVGQS